jgi:oligopeptide/dipeptide ABC transporter ATP-binding protein
MAVMYLGKLVEIGPADQVYFSPKHPYSQTLIASNPQADPNIERSRASTTIQGEIPSPINVPTGCRFADRCPSVMPVCRSEEPALISLEQALELPGDDASSPLQVACHLY